MRLAKSCHLWHCCDISLGGCGRCDRCDRWAFISLGSLGIPRPHFPFLTVGFYKVSGLCNSGHSPWPSIYWRWTWIQWHSGNLREYRGLGDLVMAWWNLNKPLKLHPRQRFIIPWKATGAFRSRNMKIPYDFNWFQLISYIFKHAAACRICSVPDQLFIQGVDPFAYGEETSPESRLRQAQRLAVFHHPLELLAVSIRQPSIVAEWWYLIIYDYHDAVTVIHTN